MINFFKRQIIIIFTFIFFIETILQLLFYFDQKLINQPALFYNGYCHQKYWDLNPKKIKFDDHISYHPLLAYKKKEIEIPNDLNNENKVKKENFNRDQVSLYGSSFLNHEKFKSLIKDNNEIIFKNYALNSYGLDQIYLSYKLTAHLNQNKTIVVGFLLEDLDRSIFNKRDYNKPKFVYIDNNFELTNVPIDENQSNKRKNDFYLYRFLGNFFSLLISNFDSRQDTCSINIKKKLFTYFFDNIQSEAKKYNQKIIVITFNLKEDIINTKSWRYNFVKNYLEQNKIIHVDSLKILKTSSLDNNENIESYYSEDLHNSKKGFEYILNEFINVYNAI